MTDHEFAVDFVARMIQNGGTVKPDPSPSTLNSINTGAYADAVKMLEERLGEVRRGDNGRDYVFVRDPQLGLMPAIPEPFWVRRSNWFFWQTVPGCYQCRLKFKNRSQYNFHYLNFHYQAPPADALE